MSTLPRPRWQAAAACALTGMLASSFAPLCGEPSHPAWWNARNVKSGNPANNKGVAIIAQLKHISTEGHAELEAVLPGGAGFALPFSPPPSNPDTAWYQDQKKVLQLGVLKRVAKDFYDRLNAISPAWVEQQLQTNGLTTLGTDYYQDANAYFYPWSSSTPVSENYKPSNLGQLKLTFCLRLGENLDGDSLVDLVEWAMYGSTAGDGTTSDYDGDGLTDALEITHGTSLFEMDTDHDGVSDGDEVAASTDPLTPATTSSPASTLEVFTPLN